MNSIKIGTRKSKLALWQAYWVEEKLKAGGFDVEIVKMETKGDKILDVSIAKIGSKGVFTEELEEKLQNGEIDIAVHSAKDMQSKLPEGFEIIAYSNREKACDVLVSDDNINLNDPNLIVGTSSTRRIAYFRHFYPNVSIVGMRGNLQTRIEKMRQGKCKALVLAYAGISRMNYNALIKKEMSVDQFIPSVGQGSIAIESSVNLENNKKEKIRALINDEKTEKALLSERSYLAEMNGGCSIPIYGHATTNGNEIVLTGGIISLDGSVRIVEKVTGTDPDELGVELSKKVIAAGGDRILNEIRKHIE